MGLVGQKLTRMRTGNGWYMCLIQHNTELITVAHVYMRAGFYKGRNRDTVLGDFIFGNRECDGSYGARSQEGGSSILISYNRRHP